MSRFDLMYLIISLMVRPFQKGELSLAEQAFVHDNARKHANVQWLNLVATILVVYGLQGASRDQLGQVITALIAPVMVMGGAWFAISFGGIPEKFLNVAMNITFWMFTAFVVSLSMMFAAVLLVVNPFTWPAFVLVYVAAVISCVLYDTADGLKAGLDDAVLRHSRAALRYYASQGIRPEEGKEE